MSTEAIIEKITADIETSVSDIQKKTEEAVQEIQEETREKAKEIEQKEQAALEKDLENAAARAHARIERDVRIEKEKALRSIIDAVFEEEYQNLVALPENDYISLVSRLISTHLPKEEKGVVYEVPPSRVKESRQALIKAERSSSNLTENPHLEGGVRYSTDTEYYDLSFRTLIDGIKEANEASIAHHITRA